MPQKLARIRVFLSWSGRKSERVARALHDWLPQVHHYVQPWMSSEDVRAGVDWSSKLATQLAKADVGIICVTSGSINKPWLFFEAGALFKGRKKAIICPYLFGIKPSALEGTPLAKFEAIGSRRKDTLRLVKSINEVLGKHALKEKTVDKSFERLWPELRESLRKI